jgi:hypothetical protein|tara:strand:+ start:2644 stop:3135 length:492 start_codon:yes stop_codon:yes gene_type:complete
MQMVEKKRKKPGRKLINIDIEQVERLASQGLGNTQIARALGVSWDTLDRNRKRSAEFEDALKRGQARGLATVTNSLYQSANDGNVTAQIFYLKNRDSKAWADKVETTFNVDLKNVIDNARERLGNDQEHIIEAKTVDIKEIQAGKAKSQQGMGSQPEEDKDKK